jgi:hypothetical protein
MDLDIQFPSTNKINMQLQRQRVLDALEANKPNQKSEHCMWLFVFQH